MKNDMQPSSTPCFFSKRYLYSFLIAMVFVLVWMIFYYGRAGWFSDVALVFNILLIFGVLASLGAVLTLPGIAGIVLTIGMSVDANVLIFERMREDQNQRNLAALFQGRFRGIDQLEMGRRGQRRYLQLRLELWRWNPGGRPGCRTRLCG